MFPVPVSNYLLMIQFSYSQTYTVSHEQSSSIYCILNERGRNFVGGVSVWGRRELYTVDQTFKALVKLDLIISDPFGSIDLITTRQ